MKLREQVYNIATAIYGADRMPWTPEAEDTAKMLENGSTYDSYATMMVKTRLRLTHDPTLNGVTKGWVLRICDVLIYSAMLGLVMRA